MTIEKYLSYKKKIEDFLKKYSYFVVHNFIYAFLYSFIVEHKVSSPLQLYIAVFFIISLLLLWAIYNLFKYFNRNSNWVVRFFNNLAGLYEYEQGSLGRPSFMGVETIIEHPDLMMPHSLKSFSGWNLKNDFHLTLNTSKEKGDYIRVAENAKLWVGSDSVNVDVPVEECDEQDALFAYCLIAKGDRIYQFNEGGFLYSFSLQKKHLDPNGKYYIFGNEFKKIIEEKLKSSSFHVGALSMFRTKEKKTGILFLIIPDDGCVGSFSLTFMSNGREIANFITKEDGDSVEERIRQYALLTYMLSSDGRFEFTKDFNSAVKKNNKRAKKREKDILIETDKNSFLSDLISWLILFRHNCLKNINDFLIGDFYTKISAIFSFVMFKLIMPYSSQDGVESFKIAEFFNYAREKIFFILIYVVILLFYLFCYKTVRWLRKTMYYRAKGFKYLLQDTIIYNRTVLPKKDKNNVRLFDPISYEDVSIAFVDAGYGDYALLDEYKSEELKNEINDGKKYRLIRYEEGKDSYDLVVDLCHYTNCRTLHLIRQVAKPKEYNEKELKDSEHIPQEKRSGAEELYNLYANAVGKFIDNNEAADLENLPPNNLCLHMVVVTNDGKILVTRRRKELRYEPDKLDFSIEEQLSGKDFCKDGKIIDNWIRRALEEELGITRYNVGKDRFYDVDITSLFMEDKYLNFSLCAIVKLDVSSNKLVSILEGWPRSDYEFRYQLVNIRQFEKHITDLDVENKDKLAETVNKWHSSAFNRIYQFSIYFHLRELNKKNIWYH